MLADLPAHVAHPNPDLYWSDNYVVLDFETTTRLRGSAVDSENRIVLACWYAATATEDRGSFHRPSESKTRPINNSVQYHFGSEYDLGELTQAIERSDFVIAHNAKFELGWLKRCGVDLHKIVSFDTMIAEHVIGGNRYPLQQLGLNKCLRRHGLAAKEATVSWMIKDGVPVEEIPRGWLLRYCIRDVEAAHELFLLQRKKLKELSLESINYQRNLLTPALTDIEFNGMQLDSEAVLEKEKSEEDLYARLTTQIQDFCEGIDPSKTRQLAAFVYSELNFKPPTDFRGRALLTPGGDFSVAAPIMAKLVPKNKKQRDFLRLYNDWTNANSNITKYLRKMGDCVRENSGLLHGAFNQCNTRTHRLSSNGLRYRIQFQNLNRDFKPLFCARRAGWSIGECDGAQLEFRVAVHLGRDKVGLTYITDDDSDIHRFTASILLGIPEGDVTSIQRQAAKPDTFKPLYGGSSGTPAQRNYYAAFKKQYKGIADTQIRWLQEVLKNKSLITEWGMRYYWPDTRTTESGYVTNTTSIYNYPVQAFATAEIIPIAIICAWHRMRNLQSFLVNTVHDSIIAELHPTELEDWSAIARQCLIRDCYELTKRLYGVSLTVPLGAGVMVSTHWSDKAAKASEVVWEAPESLWRASAEKEGMI